MPRENARTDAQAKQRALAPMKARAREYEKTSLQLPAAAAAAGTGTGTGTEARREDHARPQARAKSQPAPPKNAKVKKGAKRRGTPAKNVKADTALASAGRKGAKASPSKTAAKTESAPSKKSKGSAKRASATKAASKSAASAKKAATAPASAPKGRGKKAGKAKAQASKASARAERTVKGKAQPAPKAKAAKTAKKAGKKAQTAAKQAPAKTAPKAKRGTPAKDRVAPKSRARGAQREAPATPSTRGRRSTRPAQPKRSREQAREETQTELDLDLESQEELESPSEFEADEETSPEEESQELRESILEIEGPRDEGDDDEEFEAEAEADEAPDAELGYEADVEVEEIDIAVVRVPSARDEDEDEQNEDQDHDEHDEDGEERTSPRGHRPDFEASAPASAPKLHTSPESRASDAEGLAFRLDPSVRADAYRLHIEVDPSRDRSYRGRVEIECTLAHARSQIELHAADLELHEASIEQHGERESVRFELRPERESVLLRGDRTFDHGPIALHLSFSGQLRSDLRGFYAASSSGRNYAFTQLEAADARRFFPCFDEPSQKARFAISVRTSAHNHVFSNNPIARVERHDSGEHTVHFRETPPLSSYLVAVAVGELVASEPVYAGDVPIRVVHAPGSEAMTEFALDAARECLTRLSAYFALPYPYEKLDLVAVPDFEVGAMENAGAVFFRETLLLVDESSISLPEKKRAAEVICHELAHMWYGNLVTMRWWDDLWLNEAFATWMAFEIVSKWRPEWKMWNDFGHARNSAFTLDALDNTHAIYTEVRTPAEATQNFDAITYEKGAAVIRMIERYLGASTFQAGVRTYIARHRESNTVASDLWRALSEAAGEDVEAVVRPFIEQPGFPLVRIARLDRALRLQQERFDARGPHERAPDNTRWAVPWVGKLAQAGEYTVVRHLLTERSEELQLDDEPVRFVYGNADEGGFFRPLHAERDLPELLAGFTELDTSERLGFVQHQWALARAGYTGLSSFLPLMEVLVDEPEADVLRAFALPADFLVDDVARSAGGPLRSLLQAKLALLYEPGFDELGWGGSHGEANDVRLRRAELLTLVGLIAEARTTVERAEGFFEKYLDDRNSVDPNLIAPLLSMAARRADRRRLAILLDASESDATPQARRRFRLAIGDVREHDVVQEVLATCLTPRIPTQDVAFVIARLLRNPDAQELAFSFMLERWSALRERIPAMLVSRVIEATPALRSDAQRRRLLEFFEEHPLPTATRALRQADERFRLNAAFRERVTPELESFLSE